MIFVAINILFKLGVVPFHLWILDLYTHVSKLLVLVVDSILKFILIMIVFLYFNIQLLSITYQLLGYLSLVIGAILPFKETNMKRFFGEINIGHTGVVLILLSRNVNEYLPAFEYILAYIICFYLFMLLIEYKNKFTNKSVYKYILALILLSITGIPPFHTFLAKIAIFTQLLVNNTHFDLYIITLYFIFELIFISIKIKDIIRRNGALI